jgi:hypothetical protein
MSDHPYDKHPNDNYYAQRARNERRMMEAAADPRALASHAELTARYEALAAFPSLNRPSRTA